jgi:hypothetical protein
LIQEGKENEYCTAIKKTQIQKHRSKINLLQKNKKNQGGKPQLYPPHTNEKPKEKLHLSFTTYKHQSKPPTSKPPNSKEHKKKPTPARTHTRSEHSRTKSANHNSKQKKTQTNGFRFEGDTLWIW